MILNLNDQRAGGCWHPARRFINDGRIYEPPRPLPEEMRISGTGLLLIG